MKFKTDVTVSFPDKPRARGILTWEADLKQESWGITDITPSVKPDKVLHVIEDLSSVAYKATESTQHEIIPCPVPSKMIGLTPTLVEVGKDGKISKIQYISNAA